MSNDEENSRSRFVFERVWAHQTVAIEPINGTKSLVNEITRQRQNDFGASASEIMIARSRKC